MTRPDVPSPTPLAYSERDLDAQGVLSRKSRWRLRQQGQFPEPRKIGGRLLYVGDEIRAWIRNPEAWTPSQEVAGDE